MSLELLRDMAEKTYAKTGVDGRERLYRVTRTYLVARYMGSSFIPEKNEAMVEISSKDIPGTFELLDYFWGDILKEDDAALIRAATLWRKV